MVSFSRRSRFRVRRRRPMMRRRRVMRRSMTRYKVKRIIDAELKRHTLGLNGTAPSVTGELVDISSLIVQGPSSQTREGNWIRPVNFHGSLAMSGRDGAGQIVQVRAIIFRWNEDLLHHVPTLDDIVENDTAPHGQFNFAGKGTFKVLWTKNFQLVNQDNNPQYTKLFKFYLRLSRGPKILYDDNLPKKNQLFFAIFSDTLDVMEIPEFRLDAVLRYTDS